MGKFKIYIAGTHVFLPKAQKFLHDNLVEGLANRYGFEALIPKDGDVRAIPGQEHRLPLDIYLKNIEAMKSCDAIVANITPFRGVSMDAGTAFEVGYCRALDKTVALWSERSKSTYLERVVDYFETHYLDRLGRRGDGMTIEDFSLTENLMIVPHREVKVYQNVTSAIMHVLMLHDITESERCTYTC